MISRIFSQFIFALMVTLVVLAHPFNAEADSGSSQYYELRVYSTKSAEQQQRISDYWQQAAIPAYNRMGIQPIGVFTEWNDSPTNRIYVVIPYDSLEIFEATPAKLADDTNYQQAAAEFLDAAKPNLPYDRYESSLLIAFDGMKHLSVPSPDKKPNLFELRTYLSPNDNAGLNKVRMFNSGEIPLMQEVGLGPIFYGRTLIGSQLPCLTYMLSGNSPEEHQKNWKKFNNAPVWKGLINDPQYKGNVSGVISIMLKRTFASQI